MSPAGSLSALLNSASAYYRRAGRFAWHFARGKLKGDPVFRAILEHGLLADRARLLDLGAGQGLLAAWLLAARSCQASAQDGAWPPHWPPPPAFKAYVGVEINAQEVRRAQRAFALDAGAALQIVHADIRDVDYGTPDAIVILDVLHFLDHVSQERVLRRVRAALAPRGLLLMRIGDAEGGIGFTLSKAVDHTVAFARSGRWTALHCRPLREWQRLLSELGFRTRTVPMSVGTPFTNMLLVSELP